MIAGILQGNARQSPYVNPAAAMRRRNYTLDRMATEGFLSSAEAAEAKTRPIVTRGDPAREASFAPYYLEEVRKHLENRYGAQQLYESGLTVRTPLDGRLQRITTHALDVGLRRVDKRRTGFRRAQTQRPRQRAADRVPSRALAAAARRRRHRPGAGRAGGRQRHRPRPRDAAHRHAAGRAQPRQLPVDAAHPRVAGGRRGRPGGRRVAHGRRHGRHGDGAARTDADPRGRRRRHREPQRPRAGDGRRLQLRAQQVQPRHPGAAADRLDVQADSVYRRHRPRPHPGDTARGRTDQLRRRRRASRPTPRATTTAASKAR